MTQFKQAKIRKSQQRNKRYKEQMEILEMKTI